MNHYESGVVGTCGALVYCLLFRCGVYSNCAATLVSVLGVKGKGKVNCVCSCVSSVGIASCSSQTRMSLPPMPL